MLTSMKRAAALGILGLGLTQCLGCLVPPGPSNRSIRVVGQADVAIGTGTSRSVRFDSGDHGQVVRVPPYWVTLSPSFEGEVAPAPNLDMIVSDSLVFTDPRGYVNEKHAVHRHLHPGDSLDFKDFHLRHFDFVSP